jgi:hypothetical protein
MSADASGALNISLVGRMHRTVFVEGCNPNFYDELATLFAVKCGKIEARGMVGARYAVVFEQLNSISTAVALHGMVFIDMKSKLLIWAADKTPPTEAAQLSIDSGAAGSKKASNSAASDLRRARIESFLSLGGGGSTVSETSSIGAQIVTAQERRLQLFKLCIRQVKALNVVLAFEKEKVERELTSLEASTAATESILAGLRAGGAAS